VTAIQREPRLSPRDIAVVLTLTFLP